MGSRALQSVMCRPSIGALGLPISTAASTFPPRPRGLPGPAVPTDYRRWFILSCASFPSRVLRAEPARHVPVPGTFPGVPFPFAVSVGGVHIRGFPTTRFVPPSAFLTPSTAYSSSDLRGFVSPHNHVRDSLSRGFASHTAVRARHPPCPLAGCPALPAGVATSARIAGPAFRAFFRARIRRDPRLFKP